MKNQNKRSGPRYIILAILSIPLIYFLGVPSLVYLSYSPKEGDVLFQSLSNSVDLVRAIEGISDSEYSHCGIVVKVNGEWFVNEAYGPVHNTPLYDYINRGRGFRIGIYRLTEEYSHVIPKVIANLESFQGLPYDSRYRMDDERIYCSELIYKAFLKATGKELGELVTLGSMNWKPYEMTIEKYERGKVPLDRQMITPINMAKSEKLKYITTLGIPHF